MEKFGFIVCILGLLLSSSLEAGEATSSELTYYSFGRSALDAAQLVEQVFSERPLVTTDTVRVFMPSFPGKVAFQDYSRDEFEAAVSAKPEELVTATLGNLRSYRSTSTSRNAVSFAFVDSSGSTIVISVWNPGFMHWQHESVGDTKSPEYLSFDAFVKIQNLLTNPTVFATSDRMGTQPNQVSFHLRPET